jgi:hypothetical protein
MLKSTLKVLAAIALTCLIAFIATALLPFEPALMTTMILSGAISVAIVGRIK